MFKSTIIITWHDVTDGQTDTAFYSLGFLTLYIRKHGPIFDFLQKKTKPHSWPFRNQNIALINSDFSNSKLQMIILLFQKYATCQLVIIIPNQFTVQGYTEQVYRSDIHMKCTESRSHWQTIWVIGMYRGQTLQVKGMYREQTLHM